MENLGGELDSNDGAQSIHSKQLCALDLVTSLSSL